MITLEQLTWSVPGFQLSVDLRLGAPITGIFGPSGSGKTTLIELLAGLRRPRSGRIRLDESLVCDVAAGKWLGPDQRAIGYVPQDSALFPHLTVEENLRYGAARRRSPAKLDDSLEETCALLGIESLRAHAVPGLSGGERQRVALARALISEPRLLLLDEPFANLDGGRKEAILPYLRRLQAHTGTPMLLVSHSADDLCAVSDDVVVLHQGRTVAQGSVNDLFETQRADIRRLKSGLI